MSLWKSRKLFLILIAAITALLVAAPLASKPTVTVPITPLLSGTPADVPAVGDTWLYNLTYNTTLFNVTTKVSGIVNVQDWSGDWVQCYNFTSTPFPIGLMPSIFPNVSRMSQFSRTSDGAFIALEAYFLYNLSGPMILEGCMYMYLNESQQQYSFPLHTGLQWNSSTGPCLVNQTGYVHQYSGGVWFNVTFVRENASQTGPFTPSLNTVVNVTTVTVPAGTFECWCINRTGGGLGPGEAIEYYSPAVKNVVLMTNSTTGERGQELLSYSVSYPTRTMVMMSLSLMLLLSLSSMQQGAARNYLIIGGVAGIIIVAAAVGAFLLRRR